MTAWQKIAVEAAVQDRRLVHTVRRRLSHLPVEIISDRQVLPPDFPGLILAYQRGNFLKPCPCSSDTVRCGYYFLNVGLGCPLNCSYCFLQGFLNTAQPVIYANIEDLEQELRNQEQDFMRVGTGELTDSLVWEKYTDYAAHLIRFFATQSQAILELKTKCTNISTLLSLQPQGRVLLSWSLNPAPVAAREEKQAPTPAARIRAALQAAQAGYRLGFHFDPIILYPGWERDYYELLQSMAVLPHQQIEWISLGTFRVFPAMRHIVRRRHPQSQIFCGELVPGYDGKLRYFRPLRVAAYCRMKTWIHEIFGNVWVYLCMESPQVWEAVFGSPNVSANLPTIMNRRSQKRLLQTNSCWNSEPSP